MSGESAFIYHHIFEDRGLSPFPSVWQRYSLTKDLLEKLGIIPHNAQVVEPTLADDEMLLLAHHPDYISFVKKISEEGTGYLDGGDTPAYPGIFERASASAGASICAVDILQAGRVQHAFNPGGGLHHARYDSAAGFCVFNDIAVAVRYMEKKYGVSKVAIVDLDGHHADGTQDYFYDEKVLTISLHRYDRLFYPGSGNVDEMGKGEGRGYCINVPLPARLTGDLYLEAFHAIVPPILRWYGPEVLVVQCGVDGHYQDPLVRMYLTTRTYEALAQSLHELAHQLCGGKMVLLGGGGYNPENVARCWTVIFSSISDKLSERKKGFYESLHDSELKEPRSSMHQQVAGRIKEVVDRISEIHGNIF